MVELIKNIILKKDDINKLENLTNEREKKVIKIFINKMQKINFDNLDIIEIIKSFILEFSRGNIVSRYINGEEINLPHLENGVEMLMCKVIEENYILENKINGK